VSSLTPLAAVGTLVFTFVNFLTYLRSANWNGALTQAIAWAAGIAAMMIAAHTQFASQITFGTEKLSRMNWQSQAFLGLIATSILSTVNEVKKAIDGTDSARKAKLTTGKVQNSR
jgi:multisubunit Na+/H+ antiporter MnhB subunit